MYELDNIQKILLDKSCNEALYVFDSTKYIYGVNRLDKYAEYISGKKNQALDSYDAEFIIYLISVVISELGSELHSRTGYTLDEFIAFQYILVKDIKPMENRKIFTPIETW